MSKAIILIDSTILSNTEFNRLIGRSELSARLNRQGLWNICKDYQLVAREPLDLVDIFTLIADLTRTDYNGPQVASPPCTCPTICDCADPNHGLVSNHCPVHNADPIPYPDCPQHGHD